MMPLECDGAVSSVTSADYQCIRTIELEGQTEPWSEGDLVAELSHDHAFHFVIRSGSRETLYAYILSRFVAGELHIHRLCTHPHCRRRGLGRILLDHTLDAARSKGAKKAFLEVDAANLAAVRLYRMTGFTTDYQRKKYYASGGDALAMSLDL